MTLVFAAIAPHGAPVFDEPDGATRQAMEELGRRFAAARAETVILLTPHGLSLDGHFAVVRSRYLAGDAAQWTEADTRVELDGDPELADACVAALRADDLPAVGATFGSSLAGNSTMPLGCAPLDWGAVIPLWFLRAPAVVVSPCRALAPEIHVRAGAALVAATGTRRVALVASADHGHGHDPDGPYGFAAESEEYDRRVLELIRENRLGELVGWDPAFARAALADSFWQLLMLHGAVGDGWSIELLSYEVPTYFGMAVAALTPGA